MLFVGAMINALAFSGSNYMFSKINKHEADKERVRHDIALEKLQKDKVLWEKKRIERNDFLNRFAYNKRLSEEKKSELMSAMRDYYIVTNKNVPGDLTKLPPMPEIDDYYTPHKVKGDIEILGVIVGTSMIAYYIYKKKLTK